MKTKALGTPPPSLPVGVERNAGTGAGYSEGQCWQVVGKGVRRGLIFLQEVFPLLVVIISEHVESLLNQTVR